MDSYRKKRKSSSKLTTVTSVVFKINQSKLMYPHEVSIETSVVICIFNVYYLYFLIYLNSLTSGLIVDWPVTFGRKLRLPASLVSYVESRAYSGRVLFYIPSQMVRKQKINTLLKTVFFCGGRETLKNISIPIGDTLHMIWSHVEIYH